MDLGLMGKRALVTAASQGLGRAIATELAKEGCRVVISSRRSDTLAIVADEINALTGARSEAGTGVEAEAGSQGVGEAGTGAGTGVAEVKSTDAPSGTARVYPVRAVQADLTSPNDIRNLVDETRRLLGGIDLLVTNAGGPPGGNFDAVSDADWQHAFELNMMSVVRLIRETLPDMRTQGGGKILNISSLYVRQPNVNLILSNAIRTGTMAMLKTLALQVAPEGITVLNFAPGRIHTDRVKWLDSQRAEREERRAEDIQHEEEAAIPMRRYGQPEEVGRLVTMLLSSANSYMTGQTILADGGVISAL